MSLFSFLIIHQLYADVAAIPVKKQTDAIKDQRGAVKVLKRKSLWSKSMEDIVEKLVEIVDFMHLQINGAFSKSHADAEQSSENFT